MARSRPTAKPAPLRNAPSADRKFKHGPGPPGTHLTTVPGPIGGVNPAAEPPSGTAFRPRAHPRARVQREPFHLRAQRPLHERLIPPIATHSPVQLTGLRAQCRAALRRRRGQTRQQLVAASIRAIPSFAGIHPLPRLAQRPQDPIPNPLHQLLHVGICHLPLLGKHRRATTRLPPRASCVDLLRGLFAALRFVASERIEHNAGHWAQEHEAEHQLRPRGDRAAHERCHAVGPAGRSPKDR